MKSRMFMVLLFSGVLWLAAGCSKEDTPEPVPSDNSWPLHIGFRVDGAALEFDTIKYTNAAGNVYGVNQLQFFLSYFVFTNAANQEIVVDTVIYIDAEDAGTCTFSLAGVPLGSYKNIRFMIGMDSTHNITGCLPHTVQNMNMAWPDLMGGGYHFMKLEGMFHDGPDLFGYAMHLGKSPYAVPVVLHKPMNHMNNSEVLGLTMNINEWFANPVTYDFNTDGNYTMGVDSSMEKLHLNGTDVFNF